MADNIFLHRMRKILLREFISPMGESNLFLQNGKQVAPSSVEQIRFCFVRAERFNLTCDFFVV
jgi:hypothetical protein